MKHIIPILLLILNTTLFSQESQHDAIFHEIIQEFTLNEDGSQAYHYFKKFELNTHYSFNRLYGETFIIFNPEVQKLKINESKTTHKDGKVTMAPFNSFNEVLPRFCNDAPYYNHLREMVVTHPGTEIGAVIELDYTITTQAGYFPGLMADEIINESSPVQKKEIIIRIPSEKELNYKVLNIRTAPQIENEKGYKVYRFIFQGIKENSHEDQQPSDQDHLPRLIFSTLTWDEALSVIYKNIMPNFKVNQKMKQSLTALREENRYDLPFVLRLNKEIAENVNTYEVPFEHAGYKARTPIETWKSNGGTTIEKSLLLSALLKADGMNANIIFAVPKNLFDPEIGCLPLISQTLIQASPRELEQMYLSGAHTAKQNMIFHLNNHTLINLKPDKPTYEHIKSDFENKVITNGNFILDDSLKCSGNIEILLTEAMNPYYDLELDSSAMKSFISEFSGKEIAEANIINNAQFRSLVNLKVSKDKPLHQQANYFFFQLPENKKGFKAWNINYLHSERATTFELPDKINEQYSYEIAVPENIGLVNPLKLKELKTPFGELVLSIKQEEDKIIVKRLLVFNQTEISPEVYPDFKRMIDLWNEDNYKKLVLTR